MFQALSAERPVLVKPNYIKAKHPSTGITTDTRVIIGVVAFLRKDHIREIIIGEGTGHCDSLEAFRMAGVDRVAERWDPRIICLDKDEFPWFPRSTNLATRRIHPFLIRSEQAVLMKEIS